MNREKLIDVALKHYSKYGYNGATMRKIADDVGIKPASIYFFYDNKEALFIAAFKKLLDNHLNMMKNTLDQHREKSIDQIFIALLRGIIKHHKEDMAATTAYISLVTAPIPEIKTYLQTHMNTFSEWLNRELSGLLTESFDDINKNDIHKIVQQFNIVGNGLFWGLNVYNDEVLEQQMTIAEHFIYTMINNITTK